MAEPAPTLDPSVRAALAKLADIVTPSPPSLVPQTWGWAALAAVLVALAVWAVVRRHRHREANRYRVEALEELARLETAIGDPSGRPDALAAIPPLLKRVALAAWPRDRVAALTQSRWVHFVGSSEGTPIAEPLRRLLDDAEYRRPDALAALSADDARTCVRVARHWIESHRVPA
jgi:hypothetical protein